LRAAPPVKPHLRYADGRLFEKRAEKLLAFPQGAQILAASGIIVSHVLICFCPDLPIPPSRHYRPATTTAGKLRMPTSFYKTSILYTTTGMQGAYSLYSVYY
jgi:hypothetical protein